MSASDPVNPLERRGTGDNRYDISVILPCYNERDHVVAEIDRIRGALDASDYTYEIIVVDDCSTDGSNEVLRQVPGIRLITLPRNGGSGTARRIGSPRRGAR